MTAWCCEPNGSARSVATALAIPKSANACPTASTCATLPCARFLNAWAPCGMCAPHRRHVHRQAAFSLSDSDHALPGLSRPRGGLGARRGYEFMRTTSLSQTRSARFLPKLADQSAEWRHVQNELQAGKKLVKLFYGLTSYSPLGQGDAHERVIKAIFKAAGWDLADERFLQLQGLLLPCR